MLGQSCLLVDDDLIGALGTVAMLERLMQSVDHASSLEQARALCLAHPEAYDFFIVDLRLPDGSGIDFARQLQQNPQLRGKPVLLLSANVERVRRMPENARLFAALLEKPLDAQALGQAIRAGVQAPAEAAAPLSGLSRAAQARMAQTFAANWADFCQALQAPGWASARLGLAARAHKLANGAALFGLGELAAALRGLENACEPPAPASGGAETEPETHLETARAQVLACAPPAGWASRWQSPTAATP